MTTPRGEARLLTLVGAAADLFLEHGYEALSIDEVIARAGGSRRNIYDRFGGKEGLFVEAVKHLCAELSAPLAHLDLADISLADALRTFGHASIAIGLNPRTLAVHRLMVAEGHRFPELAQTIYLSGHRKAAGLLSDVLERHRGSTAWASPAPSLQLAQQFIGLVVAELQLRALIGLDAVPLTHDAATLAVERAVDVFLKGILGKGTIDNA